jgi:NAD(P) transhydrogenase
MTNSSTTNRYDLIAIGSGPAGQRAAVQAAKLGLRSAVIERGGALGGVSANSGTIPSKTLRAAIVELTSRAAGVYGSAFRVTHQIEMDDLLWRAERVMEHERDVIADQLRRNGVDVIRGRAAFADPRTLVVEDGSAAHRLGSERIVIATGTRPARPAGIEFDGETIVDSDGILQLRRLPRTLTVIGGGVIGLEYASMFAGLGVHVTLVEKRPRILDFVDEEIVEAVQYHLRGVGLTFRLGEEVAGVTRHPGGAETLLASGKRIPSDAVLYAAGRQGATDDLNLAAAGLEADARGRIAVGDDFRTAQPGIYAAGDVIGFPSLAATSMEQGRLAALAALGRPASVPSGQLPYGIYTIPEISFVGVGERQLTEDAVPYVVGMARYRELSRAEIAGDRTGLLKLLVDADTRRILGVHVFGTSATDLVHVGQTAMAGDLTVDYLVDAVFNVPTFSDAYKVAALDAANRLAELDAARAA